MTLVRPFAAVAAVAAAVLTAGCGALQDPYADTPGRPAAGGATVTTTPGPVSGTEAPDDLVKARPAPAPAAAARRAQSARQAASRYASAYTNWTWRTYARQQRQLVALATGKLRRELARSAPGRDQLGVLESQKQTNRGRVLSLGAPAAAPAAPRRRGAGEELYVITLEQAGSGDFTDPNQRHAAYKATVQQTPAGWLVSAWSALP